MHGLAYNRRINRQIVSKMLARAIRPYKDPHVATMALAKARWGDAIACVHCNSSGKHYYIASRRIWKCATCGKQFSARIGTMFEASPIPLDRWFAAIWLLTKYDSHLRAYRLHQFIGVSETTARFMIRRIVKAIECPEQSHAVDLIGRTALPDANIRMTSDPSQARPC
jgi:transposase-like protein